MFAYFTQFHMNDCKTPIDLPFSIDLHQNLAIDDLAINVQTFATFSLAVIEL